MRVFLLGFLLQERACNPLIIVINRAIINHSFSLIVPNVLIVPIILIDDFLLDPLIDIFESRMLSFILSVHTYLPPLLIATHAIIAMLVVLQLDAIHLHFHY